MNHDRNKGFTLIELMLAMTFIAFLLVAIAMTTIQLSNIFNRGITLREVNQAGRSVSSELQRSIASSVPFDVTPQFDTPPATPESKYVVRDGGGRLCLGKYTYAWNYGDALAGGAGAPTIYNTYVGGSPVRFAKVSDASGALCASPTTPIIRSNASELLSSGDRELVVHTLTVRPGAVDIVAGQALYAISMVIGTNDSAQLNTTNTSCLPPSEGSGYENYCSVNQFDIIARAGNAVGSDE